MSRVEPNIIDALCAGNSEAKVFLECWGDYVRAADDVIDEGRWDHNEVINALALGIRLYSTDFYRRHSEHLRLIILTVTSTYADSVEWEKDSELWKRQWADVLRHADGQLLMAVAIICGGWQLARSLSKTFLEAAYLEHKNNHGVPA